MAGGLLDARTVTFGASGTAILEWTSPRTGKRTFAKKVRVKPFTSNCTVSVNDGQSNNTVGFTAGEPAFEMEGVINRLYLTGTNGSAVAVSAEIAA